MVSVTEETKKICNQNGQFFESIFTLVTHEKVYLERNKSYDEDVKQKEKQ